MYYINVNGGDAECTGAKSSSLNHIMPAALAIAVAVLFMFCVASMSDDSAAAVEHSGTSDGCSWELADGTLTISKSAAGDGAMADYASGGSPWYAYNVNSVVIKYGVTYIGAYSFQGCGIASVTIPSSVEKIGDYAFSGCDSLNNVSMVDTTAIGEHAFSVAASTIADIADVTYDGTVKSPSVTVSWNGDDLVNDTDYSYTYSSNVNAGTVTVTVTGIGHFGGEKTTTFKILPRSVTLTSASDSATYDGTPLTYESVAVTGDGFVSSDGATYVVTGSQTSVGTSDNTFTYTLNAGTLASNYDITTAYGTLAISAKAVKVSGITASDKVYDGTTSATLVYTGAVFDGIISGDSLTVTATGTFADKNAGTAKAVSISNLVLDGDSASNYILADDSQNSTTASITAKTVTVSGITASDKVYDGNTDATLVYIGVVFDGIVDGDSLTVTATGTFDSPSTGTDKTVTISDMVLGGDSAGNYSISDDSQTTTTADIKDSSDFDLLKAILNIFVKIILIISEILNQLFHF